MKPVRTTFRIFCRAIQGQGRACFLSERNKNNVEIGNGQQLRLNFVLKVAVGQQSVDVTVADDSQISTTRRIGYGRAA
jgi:putative protein kinase ArgK-like GTPase of G3E family